MDPKYLAFFEKFQVKYPEHFKLKDFETAIDLKPFSKHDGVQLLKDGVDGLSKMQEILYAHNQFSILIIFQAMDSAGKDGAIKHVMSGLNPQGVKVTSFKAPNAIELDHDFFWRHSLALPGRGEIGIFNRSHYENVLVTRIHPEFILKENLPGIRSVHDITETFWTDRFRQIRNYEDNLHANGTLVIKFFLHLSKDEQRKRLLERIDDQSKNWKFSHSDIEERKHWDDYQHAYQEAIAATSTPNAPWYIIPADDKWFARLAVAAVVTARMNRLELVFPTLHDTQLATLKKAKEKLKSEKD